MRGLLRLQAAGRPACRRFSGGTRQFARTRQPGSGADGHFRLVARRLDGNGISHAPGRRPTSTRCPSSPASISAPRFFTILTAVQDRGRAPAVTRKTHARCCSTVPATSSPIPASVARGRALAKSGAAIEFVPLNDAPHWFDNHAERTAYDVGATARAKAAMDEVLDLWLVDQRSKDRLGWRAVGQVEK